MDDLLISVVVRRACKMNIVAGHQMLQRSGITGNRRSKSYRKSTAHGGGLWNDTNCSMHGTVPWTLHKPFGERKSILETTQIVRCMAQDLGTLHKLFWRAVENLKDNIDCLVHGRGPWSFASYWFPVPWVSGQDENAWRLSASWPDGVSEMFLFGNSFFLALKETKTTLCFAELTTKNDWDNGHTLRRWLKHVTKLPLDPRKSHADNVMVIRGAPYIIPLSNNNRLSRNYMY